MMRQHMPYYAIAAAILIVGLAAVGVPVSNLLFLGVILVCPLMMLFMMRGMHGGGGDDNTKGGNPQEHDDSSRINR
jgi:DUF2933 family protein